MRNMAAMGVDATEVYNIIVVAVKLSWLNANSGQ